MTHILFQLRLWHSTADHHKTEAITEHYLQAIQSLSSQTNSVRFILTVIIPLNWGSFLQYYPAMCTSFRLLKFLDLQRPAVSGGLRNVSSCHGPNKSLVLLFVHIHTTCSLSLFYKTKHAALQFNQT
jgi:hypothetical protein